MSRNDQDPFDSLWTRLGPLASQAFDAVVGTGLDEFKKATGLPTTGRSAGAVLVGGAALVAAAGAATGHPVRWRDPETAVLTFVNDGRRWEVYVTVGPLVQLLVPSAISCPPGAGPVPEALLARNAGLAIGAWARVATGHGATYCCRAGLPGSGLSAELLHGAAERLVDEVAQVSDALGL